MMTYMYIFFPPMFCFAGGVLRSLGVWDFTFFLYPYLFVFVYACLRVAGVWKNAN